MDSPVLCQLVLLFNCLLVYNSYCKTCRIPMFADQQLLQLLFCIAQMK